MSVTSLSNNLCTLITPVISKDKYGSVTKQWSILQTDIPCRIRYLKGFEQIQAGKEQTIQTHRIYLPQVLTVTEDMAIIEQATGNSYDIGAVNPFYRTHLQVDAVRVTPIISFIAPTTQTFWVVRNGIQVTRNGIWVQYKQKIIPAAPSLPAYPPDGTYTLDGGNAYAP